MYITSGLQAGRPRATEIEGHVSPSPELTRRRQHLRFAHERLRQRCTRSPTGTPRHTTTARVCRRVVPSRPRQYVQVVRAARGSSTRCARSSRPGRASATSRWPTSTPRRSPCCRCASTTARWYPSRETRHPGRGRHRWRDGRADGRGGRLSPVVLPRPEPLSDRSARCDRVLSTGSPIRRQPPSTRVSATSATSPCPACGRSAPGYQARCVRCRRRGSLSVATSVRPGAARGYARARLRERTLDKPTALPRRTVDAIRVLRLGGMCRPSPRAGHHTPGSTTPRAPDRWCSSHRRTGGPDLPARPDHRTSPLAGPQRRAVPVGRSAAAILNPSSIESKFTADGDPANGL